MKKLMQTLLTLCLVLFATGAVAQNQDKQNEIAKKVMQAMVGGEKVSVRDLISPAYLKIHKVQASDFEINQYYPKGFTFGKNEGDGVVTGYIWGENKSWVHKLYFLFTYDNGKHYLIPGREPSEYGFIDPWYKVDMNVSIEIEEGSEIPGGGTPTDTEATNLVSDLLDDMVNDYANFSTSAHKYIAPSFYKKERLDKSDYKINCYSPGGAKVISVNNGMVVAHIWGSGKSWINKLTFKVVKEGGRVYVYPKGYTDNNYIHPWYEVETGIRENENAGGEEPADNEMTRLVKKLMDRMTYNREGYERDMLLYIAPSYLKKYRLDPDLYKVNSYTPKGYRIISADDYGKVVVEVWGEGRSWVHELTFKVVKEDGLYYLMPGAHHSSVEYVDPWYSARTNIE